MRLPEADILACVRTVEIRLRYGTKTQTGEEITVELDEFRFVVDVRTIMREDLRYTPVARHILQTLYSFTQLQSPRVHLPLSYFSSHVITYHLVHGLSTSLPLKFGLPYLFT